MSVAAGGREVVGEEKLLCAANKASPPLMRSLFVAFGASQCPLYSGDRLKAPETVLDRVGWIKTIFYPAASQIEMLWTRLLNLLLLRTVARRLADHDGLK
jgi:hypothetical protein